MSAPPSFWPSRVIGSPLFSWLKNWYDLSPIHESTVKENVLNWQFKFGFGFYEIYFFKSLWGGAYNNPPLPPGSLKDNYNFKFWLSACPPCLPRNVFVYFMSFMLSSCNSFNFRYWDNSVKDSFCEKKFTKPRDFETTLA